MQRPTLSAHPFALAVLLVCASCSKGSTTFDDGIGGSASYLNAETCGNARIDPGEDCEAGDLDGEDCEDLGFREGMLMCDPVTCIYDTSMCEGTAAPTGATGG